VFFNGTWEKDKDNIIKWLERDYKGTKSGRILEFNTLGGPGTWGNIAQDTLDAITIPLKAIPLPSEQCGRLPKGEFYERLADALKYVNEALEKNPKEGIDIFGYSRGAVAAIELAKILKAGDKPVRFLGLIEPSATWSGLDDDGDPPTTFKIPSNVKTAWYAIARKPGVSKLGELFITSFVPQAENSTTTSVKGRIYQGLRHISAGRSQQIYKDIKLAAIDAGVPFDPEPPPIFIRFPSLQQLPQWRRPEVRNDHLPRRGPGFSSPIPFENR
jgi:hypothetical protein